MKTLAIALIIISLLVAPKVLAQDSQAPYHSQAMFHSQGDEHKSAIGEAHDKEAWDLNELEDQDELEETPSPAATPTQSPTPTPTATPTGTPSETPTASPTVSPTPTATPEVQGVEEDQSNGHSGEFLRQISDLLKQILAYLESASSKI